MSPIFCAGQTDTCLAINIWIGTLKTESRRRYSVYAVRAHPAGMRGAAHPNAEVNAGIGWQVVIDC